jgi:hypothetical protein
MLEIKAQSFKNRWKISDITRENLIESMSFLIISCAG